MNKLEKIEQVRNIDAELNLCGKIDQFLVYFRFRLKWLSKKRETKLREKISNFIIYKIIQIIFIKFIFFFIFEKFMFFDLWKFFQELKNDAIENFEIPGLPKRLQALKSDFGTRRTISECTGNADKEDDDDFTLSRILR